MNNQVNHKGTVISKTKMLVLRKILPEDWNVSGGSCQGVFYSNSGFQDSDLYGLTRSAYMER